MVNKTENPTGKTFFVAGCVHYAHVFQVDIVVWAITDQVPTSSRSIHARIGWCRMWRYEQTYAECMSDGVCLGISSPPTTRNIQPPHCTPWRQVMKVHASHILQASLRYGANTNPERLENVGQTDLDRKTAYTMHTAKLATKVA